MEMPDKVQIGAFTMSVNIDAEKLLKEGNERGETLAGLSSFEEQSITVGEFPYDYTADTIIHEILHTCFRVAACSINDEVANDNVTDVEERVISALSPILLDTLRRNPKLVRYLLNRR